MNLTGLIVGAVTFLIIGLFHVVVIKAEYYFSKRVWPCFLLLGLLLLCISLFLESDLISCMTAVLGISCLWSIKELFEQEQRVAKGWFPRNPNRKV